MTRLNLVPPAELTDQHLFAEFREIKMVPKSLRRTIVALEKRFFFTTKVSEELLRKVPQAYTLGTGHVSFFYDKGMYLSKRYDDLRNELRLRGFNFNANSLLDPDEMYVNHPYLHNDYTPTPEALALVRERIAEKIALKPSWYRYNGVPYASC